ncbi:glycosyl transferase family 1 [Thiohalorhabdus denitrificans]|nr:glycosyl transferase family 1 [Thiohalorhabdus denitrificans]
MHCLETVGSGGVEQTRLSLAKRLDPDRYEQRLVCTKAIGGLPDQFEQAGCSITEVGKFRGIFDRRPYREAFRIVRGFRPDIIHGAVYEGVALAAVAGRLGRVPVIIGEETSDPQNRSWKGSLLYRIITAFTDQMVAVSPAVESYLRQDIRLPESKVSMIANGVPKKQPAKPEVVARVREELGIGPEDSIIGTVGRLFDGHKRVSDLIRALPLVTQCVPNVKLLVVGTGPDEDILRDLAVELEIADRVIFVGYQADTQPYYQMMDIFALASAREAFGMVLVEAMFSGLPIVATRAGGIPRVVDEGETALLIDPYSPQELAASLVHLLDDPETARAMGSRGGIRAKEHFSEERYVYDVDHLYTRLMAERGLG